MTRRSGRALRGVFMGSLVLVALFTLLAIFQPVFKRGEEGGQRWLDHGLEESWRRLTANQPPKIWHEEGSASVWQKYCRQKEHSTEKRVLVTGSAGFIGYHTSLALHERGDFVIGLDNFNSYYPVAIKRERAHALEEMDMYTIEGDLADTELLKSVLKECEITHVVHLAAQAGVRYAKEHPMTYIESNVQGSVSVFEAARHVERSPVIVYASSSSVYGSNSKAPFSEDDAVDNPTSLYGATKRSVELTSVVYHRLFGLSLTGLRFFTVYGPMGRPDMACFQFARSILKQQPLQIYTSPDGTELSRDFTYVDDIVRGILGSVDSSPPSTKEQATNRIFNLGNTHPVTVTQFVTSLERAMGQEAKKEYVPIRNTGDVQFTHANITKAQVAFDFTAVVSLDEGLDRFVAWFKEYSKLMSPELWKYPETTTL